MNLRHRLWDNDAFVGFEHNAVCLSRFGILSASNRTACHGRSRGLAELATDERQRRTLALVVPLGIAIG